MSQSTMLVGPRGWAALTLAGGSVLALPFLRPTQSLETNSLDPETAAVGQDDAAGDGIASFHAAANPSVMSGRRVVGNLPSTRQLAPASDLESFAVPDWARPGSKLDELITSEATSLPTPKLENLPSTSVAALRPWTPADQQSPSVAADGTVPWPADRAPSQLSMRPVLPPAITQPQQSAQVEVASGAPGPGLVVQTTAMTALPDYGSQPAPEPTGRHEPQGSVAEDLPLPPPELRRRDRSAHPPRKPAFVYQPGLPRE
ncbi:MAG: hypothetical protein Aurels2KO_08170 [Aureliella sp.]